jgi:hypothetical protein
VGYLAVASTAVTGRPDGPAAERRSWSTYQGLLPDPTAAESVGDGLIPLGSALLPGAPSLVLTDARHGQWFGRDWYGSDRPMDRWWPVALETWQATLRARAESVARGGLITG